MKTRLFVVLSVLFLMMALPVAALADGIVIPEPPVCDPGPCDEYIPISQLSIRYHYVDVTIEDQVAITHVDQVFYNPNPYEIEGTYIFPLPEGAVVNDFVLWIDGMPVQGQVLDADEARDTYEEIVATMKDPALLEYVGRGAVQASIYPIPAYGERRIELEYSQALTAENGLVNYMYPLNTEKFSITLLEDVRVTVNVAAQQDVRAIYSPSHPILTNKISSNRFSAEYHETYVLPDADFSLYYSIGETEAFHLMSYIDPNDPLDPNGFFMMLLAPQPDVDGEAVPKNVILVLDRSGSMEGEKFLQAQEAMRFVLNHLGDDDRFNMVAFDTDIEHFSWSLEDVDEVPDALNWVDSLSTGGSTDINRALLEAVSMVDEERPTYLIFLTDGLPTEGVVDTQQILQNMQFSAPGNIRLFAFGVGYDVDTVLLDTLADNHSGDSEYVVPGEAIDEEISAFYAKISNPVLTNLELQFNGLTTYDIYPDPLPDLFKGSQIVVLGRYREGGTVDVRLTGYVNGQKQTFNYEGQKFATNNQESTSAEQMLPRLWATRKIGNLLQDLTLYGTNSETVDQIVKLSIRYGIVTPYTSYLVTEDMPIGLEEQDRIVQEEMELLTNQPTQPVTGAGAIEKSEDVDAMLEGEEIVVMDQEYSQTVKLVLDRTFVFVDGIWMDTAYDPDTMETIPVAFLSDDYFALAASDPVIAAAFALGDQVIVLADGAVYQVVDPDQDVEPIQIPMPGDSEPATVNNWILSLLELLEIPAEE